MQTRQIHNLARSNKLPLLPTLVNLQPPYERHGDTIYRLSIRGPEHATTNMLDETFTSMVYPYINSCVSSSKRDSS